MSTWPEAERTCNSVDAHLISIHTIEENNFVQTLEHKAGHWLWIGGNVTYQNGEAVVRWTDGTDYDFSWFRNMHTGSSQCLNYGDRKFTDRWFTDTDCNTNEPYYCKKPAAF
uniref:C-type lectin domain-containing protein n=1 Tax=Panagrolaimus sp. ES5 TaxID=591445 RepID=A0AC34FS03_9BILA